MLRRAAFTVVALLAVLASARAQDCAETEPGDCSLLDSAEVIFVGTVVDSMDRFRVTEAFKGVTGTHLTVLPSFGGSRFEVGEQYLVFAASCFGQSPFSGCLQAVTCSNTRPKEYAAAMIEQLRAEKSGHPVAAVYGTLVRKLDEDGAIADESYNRPLSGVRVRLQSGEMSFETRTRLGGVYAFASLPPGKYQVSADLPPNLVLAGFVGFPESLPPIDMPPDSCYENDLFAFPTGRIGGKVIGPDGKPLETAVANLFRADRYLEGGRSLLGYQGKRTASAEWRPFEFRHLPAGDYVLAFNPANQEDPNSPFPRTFYPNSSSLGNALKIRLSDGQQILDADIRLPNPLPTRQIAVRLDWNGRTPQEYLPPWVIAKASRGTEPYLVENRPGAYIMSLLLSARYTIHVEAYCKVGTAKARTGEAVIDGGDPSASEVTLTFDKGSCAPK
jgi:hypothetical protein